MKKKFDVSGMTCSSCVAHVEKAVSKLDGVKDVEVSLMTNSMNVVYDENAVSPDDIATAVSGAGYNTKINESGKALKSPKDISADESRKLKRRLILSVIFLIPLFTISMGHMVGVDIFGENYTGFSLTQLLLTIPIIVINFKYFTVGFKSLFKGSPNMDTLIAVGSAAAFLYGVFNTIMIITAADTHAAHGYAMDLYFESAGMILTLITVGKFLETRSKGKTSEAISKLIELAPKTAVIEENGQEREIPAEDIKEGDIVVVRSGSSVPVDGVVVYGTASVDEAAITGESIPVDKKEGDKVISATGVTSGFIKVKALKVGADTTLSNIIRLVDEAASSKAPIARLADKIAGIFVPVVMCIAAVVIAVWLLLGHTVGFALSAGIAVLVISCPCALGLATPTAVMVGTGKGAQYGILIKSAEALETAHGIDTVVLDKTGTITEGKPRVTDIFPLSGASKERLLQVAGSLERPSDHPIAGAINEYVSDNQLEIQSAHDFRDHTGKGIEAKIEDRTFFAGNRRLMEELNIDLSTALEKADACAQEGKTSLFFADEERVLGIIAVADTVKATSREAIAQFEELGIDTVVLTGDNKTTANAIAKQLGIRNIIAEVLPHQKEMVVSALKKHGRRVAMVGDGINDAPALASADVGIAIGAGTDIAIESADIVLMKSDLRDGATAIMLSKAVLRNIKENLFWAFIYNVLGIPVAAGVFYGVFRWLLNPMFAAAAMSLSSVCVVMNALRLFRFRPEKHKKSRAKRLNSTEIHDIIKTIDLETEETKMAAKTYIIEGMSCGHCSSRVEQALNALDGITATVDLDSKMATVTANGYIDDEAVIRSVTDAGYSVKTDQV